MANCKHYEYSSEKKRRDLWICSIIPTMGHMENILVGVCVCVCVFAHVMYIITSASDER